MSLINSKVEALVGNKTRHLLQQAAEMEARASALRQEAAEKAAALREELSSKTLYRVYYNGFIREGAYGGRHISSQGYTLASSEEEALKKGLGEVLWDEFPEGQGSISRVEPA